MEESQGKRPMMIITPIEAAEARIFKLEEDIDLLVGHLQRATDRIHLLTAILENQEEMQDS